MPALAKLLVVLAALPGWQSTPDDAGSNAQLPSGAAAVESQFIEPTFDESPTLRAAQRGGESQYNAPSDTAPSDLLPEGRAPVRPAVFQASLVEPVANPDQYEAAPNEAAPVAPALNEATPYGTAPTVQSPPVGYDPQAGNYAPNHYGSPGNNAPPAEYAPAAGSRFSGRTAVSVRPRHAFRSDSVELGLLFSIVPRDPLLNVSVRETAGGRIGGSVQGSVVTAQYLNDQSAGESHVEQVAMTRVDTAESSEAPLRLSPPSRPQTPKSGPELSKSAPQSIWGVVGSLTLVLGLFIVIAWVTRRSLPRSSRPLQKEVVEVLGRASLAARQQMHLVRVGRKLLLLSVTPSGAETLTEVTDPDEVDRLCALVQQESAGGATSAFRSVLAQLGREPAPAGFLGDEPPFDLNTDPEAVRARANRGGGGGDRA